MWTRFFVFQTKNRAEGLQFRLAARRRHAAEIPPRKQSEHGASASRYIMAHSAPLANRSQRQSSLMRARCSSGSTCSKTFLTLAHSAASPASSASIAAVSGRSVAPRSRPLEKSAGVEMGKSACRPRRLGVSEGAFFSTVSRSPRPSASCVPPRDTEQYIAADTRRSSSSRSSVSVGAIRSRSTHSTAAASALPPAIPAPPDGCGK